MPLQRQQPQDQPELRLATNDVDLFDAIRGHVKHWLCVCGTPQLPETVIHTSNGGLGDNVVFACVCKRTETHAERTLIDLEVARRSAVS